MLSLDCGVSQIERKARCPVSRLTGQVEKARHFEH
jgi:hypothetical protein